LIYQVLRGVWSYFQGSNFTILPGFCTFHFLGVFGGFSIFARRLPYEAAKVSRDLQAKKTHSMSAFSASVAA